MALTRKQCLQHVGKPVVVRTHDGAMHQGILHRVTHDGIYLRRMGAGYAAAEREDLDAQQAIEHEGEQQAEEAFWPFFFLPFLALSALWPWYGGWWW